MPWRAEQIIYTASLVVASYQMLHGGARHLYYLLPDQVSTVLKLEIIGIPLGIMSQAFGKASVAFFILRLMSPATAWRRRFLYINMGLYALASVLNCIFTFVQCSPVTALWEMVPNAKCWNTNTYLDFSIFQSCKLSILMISFLDWLRCSVRRLYGLLSFSTSNYYRLELAIECEEKSGTVFPIWRGCIVSYSIVSLISQDWLIYSAGISAIIKTTQLSGFGNHADSTCKLYYHQIGRSWSSIDWYPKGPHMRSGSGLRKLSDQLAY